mmetsp:Transcript_148843/g.414705  ORF Transcript_148843/g.414705 Transcript_148843/m.414705 type:complete len:213 (+) Transcript_148843:2508-3146(+)
MTRPPARAHPRCLRAQMCSASGPYAGHATRNQLHLVAEASRQLGPPTLRPLPGPEGPPATAQAIAQRSQEPAGPVPQDHSSAGARCRLSPKSRLQGRSRAPACRCRPEPQSQLMRKERQDLGLWKKCRMVAVLPPPHMRLESTALLAGDVSVWILPAQLVRHAQPERPAQLEVQMLLALLWPALEVICTAARSSEGFCTLRPQPRIAPTDRR